MSGRKIGFLLLLLVFGATIETVWSVHGDLRLGPEGCRVVSGRFYGPSWSFEQTAERALSGAAPRVEISNAFGDVKVIAGAPGVVRAKLRKVVYQPTEDRARAFADRIELRLAGDGQPLRVGTNRSELERGEQVGFETHLQVEAPADTVLTVRNEHGRVDVAGIAAADVTSSFEGVSVERLLGELKVDSRHGDVSVSEVGGPVVLGSRFGAVELRDLRGPARVDLQHGDLKAEQTGALEVRQQYGSLTADGVGGDLVVRATHAELRANDVTGKADLETSFGGVHLERVGGEARGRVEHGGFHAEDVTGGVDAETSHDGITLARVGGPVEAHARFGGLEAHGLARGARVRAENGDVQLEGFSGPVDVQVQRGSAQLRPRAVLDAPLTVEVGNGEARLAVPEGSRLSLLAQSRRGEVRSELPGLASTGSEGGPGHRLQAQLGGGGANVTVRADGDVTLESQSASAIADQPIARPSARPPAEQAAATPRPAERANPTPR
ncbi:MAG TPA: DUF4097 family beta strand repeat-containing protein [Vicinamibacteria bacterium]|nr:DUF4097 family beta strand repeat-containing protein [Vicinamibacteria bacterium]